MPKRWSTYKRKVTRRRTVVGLLSILMVVMLVAVACGEDATATPVPSTATSVPATSVPATPVPATSVPATSVPATSVPATSVPATSVPATSVPATAAPAPTTGLRPRSEWTVDNPATLAEIEAGLERHRGETIVLMSWGGAYMAAQQSAWLDPILEKFGINVQTDSPGSYAKLRAMAETGNVTWHFADYGTASGVANGLAGASEEIDRSVVDVRDWMDVVVNPWSGGGAITWAWNIAYSTETYPNGGPQPSTASDFWDVEKFPGDRGMHGAPRSWYVNLRFAQIGANPELLDTAAGRAELTRLSQEQIDEAYVFLEEFKPNVTRWYAQVAECPQLLLSGEVDMCIVPGGRIVALALEGAPVKFCFSCGQLLITDYFAITNGLKAQDPVMYELAEFLMAWMAFPEINVNISKHINYGPVNLKSLSLLDGPAFDTYRPFLATAPETVGFSIIPDVVFDGTIGDVNVDRHATFLAK